MTEALGKSTAVTEGLIVKGFCIVLAISVSIIGYFLGGALDTVQDVSNNVIRLQEWRDQVTAQNTVPREVLETREEVTRGLIEQQRVRIDGLEAAVRRLEAQR
jgi:hypothetical protein